MIRTTPQISHFGKILLSHSSFTRSAADLFAKNGCGLVQRVMPCSVIPVVAAFPQEAGTYRLIRYPSPEAALRVHARAALFHRNSTTARTGVQPRSGASFPCHVATRMSRGRDQRRGPMRCSRRS